MAEFTPLNTELPHFLNVEAAESMHLERRGDRLRVVLAYPSGERNLAGEDAARVCIAFGLDGYAREIRSDGVRITEEATGNSG